MFLLGGRRVGLLADVGVLRCLDQVDYLPDLSFTGLVLCLVLGAALVDGAIFVFKPATQNVD